MEDLSVAEAVVQHKDVALTQPDIPLGVRADEVTLHDVAAGRDEDVRDDVACARRRPAEQVAAELRRGCVLDVDAGDDVGHLVRVVRKPERACGVRPDEVALNRVVRTGHAYVRCAVPGDDVSGGGVCPAYRVVRGVDQPDSGVVPALHHTRSVCADEAALYDVAAAALQPDARADADGEEAVDDESADGAAARRDLETAGVAARDAAPVQFDEQDGVVGVGQRVSLRAGLRVAVDDDGVNDCGQRRGGRDCEHARRRE